VKREVLSDERGVTTSGNCGEDGQCTCEGGDGARLEVRYICSWSLAESSYGLLYMIEVDLMYIMYHPCPLGIVDDTIPVYIPRVNLG
jgi:hypothetical protein